MMNSLTALGIFAGGGLGSLLRFAISIGMGKSNLALPLATFISNISACFVMLLVFMISEHTQLSTNLRLMILTGFCGGLSTFSTFSFETAALIKQGDTLWAILNVAISVILCVGILYVAYRKAA